MTEEKKHTCCHDHKDGEDQDHQHEEGRECCHNHEHTDTEEEQT